MNANEPFVDRLLPRTRSAFLLGATTALLVLGSTVLAGFFLVRSLVRQQIAQRDAVGLHATTLMEQLDAQSDDAIGSEFSDAEIGFNAAILASRLQGVMGIRFFDASGRFTDSFPATIQPASIHPGAAGSVQRLSPHSRFQPDTPLDEIFIYLPEFATGKVARVPTLQVTVPLHRRDQQTLAGSAEFIVDGHGIAAEYDRLDRHLGGLALLGFVVSSLLLLLMLWPAFRKVNRLNHELATRNAALQQANQELALTARASALGAVSAHLMHGLKNPLSSLSDFVATQRTDGTKASAEDLQDALSATRRMKSLVSHTLEVLADATGAPTYEIPLSEWLEDLLKRVSPEASLKGVQVVATPIQPDPMIQSRQANLAGLILVNLLENAIQATPSGLRVALQMAIEGPILVCRVSDQGPGLAEHLRTGLFLPCKSNREGGSGIGLAISRKIAEMLGADLALETSTPQGCVFRLALPLHQPLETSHSTQKATPSGSAP